MAEPPPSIAVNGEVHRVEDDDDLPLEERSASFPMLDGPQRAAAPGRHKVVLPPGHTQMDWLRLTNSGADLRGVPGFGRYTTAEVRQHNTEQDCWIILHGKVFNVTAYANFHPGGRDRILKYAGRDVTKLFNYYHAWVNYEFLLAKCCVGYWVPDPVD